MTPRNCLCMFICYNRPFTFRLNFVVPHSSLQASFKSWQTILRRRLSLRVSLCVRSVLCFSSPLRPVFVEITIQSPGSWRQSQHEQQHSCTFLIWRAVFVEFFEFSSVSPSTCRDSRIYLETHHGLLLFNLYVLTTHLFRRYVNSTVTVYGVVSHKASHTLRPLLIYCASPSYF